MQVGQACTDAVLHARPEQLRLLLGYSFFDTKDESTFIQYYWAGRASPEIFELLATTNTPSGWREWMQIFQKLLPAGPNASTEANALQCIRTMGTVLNHTGLEACLNALGQRCCSSLIAQFCLENGASVEAKAPNPREQQRCGMLQGKRHPNMQLSS